MKAVTKPCRHQADLKHRGLLESNASLQSSPALKEQAKICFTLSSRGHSSLHSLAPSLSLWETFQTSSVLARFSAHRPSWDPDTTNKSKEPRGPAVATAGHVKPGSSLVFPLQSSSKLLCEYSRYGIWSTNHKNYAKNYHEFWAWAADNQPDQADIWLHLSIFQDYKLFPSMVLQHERARTNSNHSPRPFPIPPRS